MRKKEKTSNGLVIFIILIIVVGIIIGIIMPKKQKNNKTNEDKNNQTNIEVVNKENTNKIENNTAIENNEEQNSTTENKETQTETFTESPKSDREKAIDIVKKAYGEGQHISFNIQTDDDGKGRIVVSVTDTNTTRNVFYHVDIGTGKYEIQY